AVVLKAESVIGATYAQVGQRDLARARGPVEAAAYDRAQHRLERAVPDIDVFTSHRAFGPEPDRGGAVRVDVAIEPVVEESKTFHAHVAAAREIKHARRDFAAAARDRGTRP